MQICLKRYLSDSERSMLYVALRRIFRKFPPARWLWEVRQGGALAAKLPVCWLRRPALQPGARVCVFVMLASSDRLLPHSVDLARAWHNAGFAVVAVIVASTSDAYIDVSDLSFAAGILTRENVGYDFGAWSAAILRLKKQIQSAAVLAVANDSVLGPSAGFATTIEHALSLDADVTGLVESSDGNRHLQSFVLLFNRSAIKTRAFWQFWRRVRSGDRQYVITRYEMSTVEWFERARLSVSSLIPAHPEHGANPTIDGWSSLLMKGLPFIKIQLLRDNPRSVDLSNWEEIAKSYGFNMSRLHYQIAALSAAGSREWRIPLKPGSWV
jgi:hypothetical protein